MNKFILSLNDAHANIENVGGKGASLARLKNAGLPVPDGFFITTSAYNTFEAENNLQPRIMEALKTADISQPKSLEAVAQTIHNLFADATMPSDVATSIEQAYKRLSDTNPVVAVRSSATAEDLPDLSFAGQQDTYLNITGITDILQAVKKCWASLWTARAIGYRIRNGIDQKSVSLSVVIQLLVPADGAGIMFTANPVNRKHDEMMITAAWGLGEAVVGGAVTPDTITVDKTSGQIKAYDVAHKEMMTVRVNGGTENQTVPVDLQNQPVLNDKAISQLIDLGKRIEELYEQPMDIEWTLENGKIAIVQARPITTLGKPVISPPETWELPDPKGHYMRASIIDLMPDPLTPLFETLGLTRFNQAMWDLVGRLTKSSYVLSSYSTITINGYAYMVVSLSVRDWAFLLFRFLPIFPSLLKKGREYWKEVACIKYAEITNRWEQKEHSELLAGELLVGIRELVDAAMEHLTSVMLFLGACAGSEGLTTSLYDKMIKREGDPIAPALVMGYDSVPVLAEKALYDLAQWCQTQSDLSNFLLKADNPLIIDSLASKTTPEGVNVDHWLEWKDRFNNYLREFGHSIYDLDFGEPLPSDNPAPFLENCKLYISGEGQNPYERQKFYAERRESLVKESFSRIKGLKAKIFRMVLNWAQGLAPLREDGIANMGYGYPVLRQMAKEIGRRLVEQHALEQPEDIFWMLEDEVAASVQSLDDNLPLSSFAEAIQLRKATWRARKSVTPPPQLPVKEKYLGINTDVFLAHGTQEGDTIKGVSGSPGRVTATARVLYGPEDFDKLQKGDVLVASITTPAWTPLFVMASAVVTDIGGPLSHGSIVAREYGIPAVLGTGVATHSISDGQTITVNGNTGEVILVPEMTPVA
jgi:phosphohistidine swiveling domain-containing protein/uncharacterized protein (UPF0147 family)